MKRTEVTFTRDDGSEATEYVWGTAPKVKGFYAETYWVLHDGRFLLVGNRRGEREGPYREVLTVGPWQRVEVTASGWVDPRHLIHPAA